MKVIGISLSMNSMCCRNIKSVPKHVIEWMVETLGFA